MRVLDTASLVGLEARAWGLGLSQRLDPEWVRATAAPDGVHYLWPALWHDLSHRPDVPRHLRCELLISLRAGERLKSLLDVLPDDFAPLPVLASREEVMEAGRRWENATSVREWLEAEGVRGEA
ncbi:hypothetical protein FXF68_39200 [Actinomadura decatromicini]|uniref:Uncharacterized protein n=1 Tax=Actinomadura decatromicini TaxID=2604572 RepID=A0A5D3F4W1_9ACTN|nr:hypothetical protein FXF68_39200 [Actinomadura decatromicini]